MGANEAKLDRAVQAHPGAIEQAADTWQKAADGLGKVKEQLDNAKQSIAAAWTGDDADAATAAFSSLSGNVDTNQTRMESASTALNTAAQGIRQAQSAKASLPPAGVMPSQPTPGADGQVSHEQRIAYSSGVDEANAADAQREKAALRAYNDLQGAFKDSQITMTAAAPPRYDTGGTAGGTGGGGGTTTGGGTVGGGLPGTVGGGGPVGPYSTSTGGTHVHAQVVGPGGHVIGFDPLVHPIAGWHPGTTADGVVDGTVGGSLGGGTGGSALGLTGGTTVPGGLGATPGSLAGGAVGGLSGVLGGAGALGSLRGGASSATNAGGAVAGRLGGAAGPLGGVPGSTTSAVGGATRGATLGSVGRSAVVGGTPGTPGVTGTAGSAGSAGRTGMMPGSGTAGGQSTGGAGKSASGRYASAAEEEAAAGRGGRSTTGMRSGGRSAVVSEGAGGRGTGAASGPGAGKDDKAAKRKGMVFEDDDAWLDEDESGPDVIR